jgi:hypothetical protein
MRPVASRQEIRARKLGEVGARGNAGGETGTRTGSMPFSLTFQTVLVNIINDDAGCGNTRRRLTTTTLSKEGRSWLRAIVVGD